MRIDFDEMRDRLTKVLSEHEDRNYLGMSSIGKCPRWLYHEMKNGRAAPSYRALRLFHEGYLHEHDLLERLKLAGYAVEMCGFELIAPFDERFRGHIDGVLVEMSTDIDFPGGTLLEIKSVDDQRFAVVQELGALAEHRAQCLCYMRYGGFTSTLIIYKQRSTGELWMVAFQHDEHESGLLEAKAKMILAAVDGKGPLPKCTCGRCR